MDLTKLDVVSLANEGATLELRHPVTGDILTDDTEEQKPFYVQLLGTDSDAYRSVLERRTEKNLNRKDKKIDVNKMKQEAARLLAKCTINCYMIENGKLVGNSKDDLTRLYLRYPWIKEQVEEFMIDRSNFIKP